MVIETVETATARGRMRSIVEGLIEGRPELSLVEVANDARVQLEADPQFVAAFLSEYLPSAVYDVVQRLVAEQRQPKYRRKGESIRPSRFYEWYEHAGDRNIRVLDMTRDDLRLAAEEREQRGATELRLARFWRSLASKLKSGQTVGDRYTAEQIEAMYEGGRI
jgi:hypothetical protein